MRTHLVFALTLAWSSKAPGVEFVSQKDALALFLPGAAKEQHRPLGAELKRRLEADYGVRFSADESAFFSSGDPPEAFVFIVTEQFNTCFHKFAVGLKADGTLIGLAIVELSCPRALPINTKRFLGQFAGKHHTDPLTTGADIDAVTGASLSSEAASVAVRTALALHHLLLGGARPATPKTEVRAAREKGAQMIREAEEPNRGAGLPRAR